MEREKTDFEKVFGRLISRDITTQCALAKILGITPSAVSCAKIGGKFPRRWAESLSQKLNIGLDFLLFGEYKGLSVDALLDRLVLAEQRNMELEQMLKEQELLLSGIEDRPIRSLNKHVSSK